MKQGKFYISMLSTRIRRNPSLKNRKKRSINHYKEFAVELVAIGNGTASRETEQFVVDVLKGIKGGYFLYDCE